jgi:hypothetical protein
MPSQFHRIGCAGRPYVDDYEGAALLFDDRFGHLLPLLDRHQWTGSIRPAGIEPLHVLGKKTNDFPLSNWIESAFLVETCDHGRNDPAELSNHGMSSYVS